MTTRTDMPALPRKRRLGGLWMLGLIVVGIACARSGMGGGGSTSYTPRPIQPAIANSTPAPVVATPAPVAVAQAEPAPAPAVAASEPEPAPEPAKPKPSRAQLKAAAKAMQAAFVKGDQDLAIAFPGNREQLRAAAARMDAAREIYETATDGDHDYTYGDCVDAARNLSMVAVVIATVYPVRRASDVRMLAEQFDDVEAAGKKCSKLLGTRWKGSALVKAAQERGQRILEDREIQKAIDGQ